MCSEWDNLFAEFLSASAEYRMALTRLESEQDPATVRYAIRMANVAHLRCNVSAEELRQHVATHRCSEVPAMVAALACGAPR